MSNAKGDHVTNSVREDHKQIVCRKRKSDEEQQSSTRDKRYQKTIEGTLDKINDDEEVKEDDGATFETNAKDYKSAKVGFECLD